MGEYCEVAYESLAPHCETLFCSLKGGETSSKATFSNKILILPLGFPACPSPVFGRSGTASSGLNRAVSWPVGKLAKSPGEASNVDEAHGTYRQLSDPVSKQQFQSLGTDVKSIGLCFLIIRLKMYLWLW